MPNNSNQLLNSPKLCSNLRCYKVLFVTAHYVLIYLLDNVYEILITMASTLTKAEMGALEVCITFLNSLGRHIGKFVVYVYLYVPYCKWVSC